MDHRIQKRIELNAPVSRVWKALTDHREFGEWFRVKIDAPFVAGQVSTGHITYPGFEHVKWQAKIQEIQPQSLFSYTWHPYAVDTNIDYSAETPTLVEFRLTPTATGTLLVVTESGFEKIPIARRDEAFRKNDGGWAQQLKNIQTYVSQKP